MKNILITGGGGYVGSNLTKELLLDGYNVTVLDTFWFGNYLKRHKNLKILKKDIRMVSDRDIKNIDWQCRYQFYHLDILLLQIKDQVNE